MNVRWKMISGGLLLVGIGVLAVWGYISHRADLARERQLEQPIEARSTVTTENGAIVIALDDSTRLRIGLRLTALRRVQRRAAVLGYGKVLSPLAFAELRQQYVSARSKLEGARARLQATRQEYQRLKQLYNENPQNISAKALQAAESAWRQDQAQTRAAEAALRAIESSGVHTWGERLAGWVIRDTPAFRKIASGERLVVRIAVSPAQLIPSPPEACLVDPGGGARVLATLISQAPQVDPRLQNPTFFYLVASGKAVLLPGMTVLSYLSAGSYRPGVVIPDSAVVWWQGSPWVYVQSESGHFVRRPVSTDTPVEDGWFVADGVVPGDRIVVCGAQLLLSEEFRQQTQVGEEGGPK